MATTPISPNSLYKDGLKETDRTPKQDLGKDEFLQILSMQLANQDPLSPMSDTDFIAQMAQFSSLEQMQGVSASMLEMSNSTASTQAYALIGKDIMANVTDNDGATKPILGRVQGVVRENGTDYLTVGEYMIPLKAIIEVIDSGTDHQGLLAQSAHLIGKTVDAKWDTGGTDEKTLKPILEDVTGEVESIIDKSGILWAKLKGTDKEVMVAEIKKVY